MASDEEKRKKKEQDAKDWEAIRQRQQEAADRRRENAINAAAEKEMQERLEDEFLDREFLRLLDTDAKAARDYLTTAIGADPNDPEAIQAMKALEDAAKAMEGGIFSGPNPGKAKNIIKKNQQALRNTIKKGKKKKGCLGALVVLAGTAAASLYGMYEGVSAIASALF